MKTEHEFDLAFDLVSACRATIACGCEHSERDADRLYYIAKKYVETYRAKYVK